MASTYLLSLHAFNIKCEFFIYFKKHYGLYIIYLKHTVCKIFDFNFIKELKTFDKI